MNFKEKKQSPIHVSEKNFQVDQLGKIFKNMKNKSLIKLVSDQITNLTIDLPEIHQTSE
jgi:hypothetical protein